MTNQPGSLVGHYIERCVVFFKQQGVSDGPVLQALEDAFPDVIFRVRAGVFRVPSKLHGREHTVPALVFRDPRSFTEKEAAATARRHRAMHNMLHDTNPRFNNRRASKGEAAMVVGPPDHPLANFALPQADPGLASFPQNIPHVLQFVGMRRLQSADLDFFYLNPVDVFPEFQPYDAWTVVKKAELAKEHMMIALTGVTHIRPGNPVDFVPLAEWADERNTFHLLRKLKFFRQYLIRKSFRAWVQQHRHKKFVRARDKLTELAYIGNRVYQRSLLKVRASTVAIQDMHFAPLQPHMTYSLSMVESIQKKGFAATEMLVTSIMHELDDEFAQLKVSLQEQIDALDEAAYEARPNTATRWRNPKNASKLETQILAVEVQMSKLPAFKRLAFTVLVQELIGFASRSPTLDYKPAINTALISGRGLFWVQVHSMASETAIAPRPSGMELFSAIQLGYEELANLILRMSRDYAKTHVALRWYRDARGNAIEDYLVQSVLAHPQLVAAMEQVEENVFSDLASTTKMLEDQHWIWDVIAYVRNWDEGQLAHYTSSLDEVFPELVKLDLWVKDLKQIDLLRVSAAKMFCVDNRLVGTILLPRLSAVFRDLDSIFINRISRIARETLELIQSRVQELTRATAMDNPTLNQYTKFVAGVRKAQKQVQSSKESVMELERLFDEHVRIRLHFRRKGEESLDATLADLNAKHTEFLRMVSAANALRNALAPMMSGKLMIRLRGLEAQINSIEVELQNSPFVQPAYKAKYVLDQLRKVGVRQRLVTEEAKSIAQALKVITEEIPDMAIFENGIKTLEIRRKIWELKDTFSTVTHKFLRQPFNEQDVSVMLAKLMEWRLESCSLLVQQTEAASRISGFVGESSSATEFASESMKTLMLSTIAKVKWRSLTRGPLEDKVLAHLLGRLDRILDIGSVLRDLNHPAFKVRHWKALFAALGRHYDPATKYTLCSLLAVRIGDYDLLVQRLNILARLEHEQYGELQEVKHIWGEQTVPMEPRCVRKLKKKEASGATGMPTDASGKAKWRWKKVADYMLSSMRDVKKMSKQASKSQFGTVTQFLERNLLGPDGVDVLGNTDEIETRLADHMVVMNRILGSGSDEFKDDAEDWLTNFQALKEILSTWRHVQEIWYSLSQMFHTFHHPVMESRVDAFNEIDARYRAMTKDLFRSPLAMSLLQYRKTDMHYRDLQGRKLRAYLHQLQTGLETLFHSINTHVLQAARDNSPRLYFLTDSDLVQMLKHPHVPSSSANYLGVRCFNSVVRFIRTRLDEGELKQEHEALYQVDGFEGMAGKRLMFSQPVVASHDKKFLAWHGELEGAMRSTLTNLLRDCLSHATASGSITDLPQADYEQFLEGWPLQTVVLTHEICFSRLVDKALRAGSDSHAQMSKLSSGWGKMCEYLNAIILRQKVTKKSHAYRSVLGDLYLTVLHQRERLDQLSNEEGLSVTMYAWQRHCRYAADVLEDDSVAVTVMCLNTTLDYTHEFLGAAENLIYVTPLAERNFLNIAMAIHGFTVPVFQADEDLVKTSTAREAASRLGRNLSEIMCSSETGCDLVLRLLTGVMKVGNWLLLRSIHKLSAGTQSLLGVCFLKLYWSHASATDGVNWTGDSTVIPWNANAGFMATTTRIGGLSTMPALSDGLKSALRPMYLVSPDLDVVVETEFILCGFGSYRALTQKLRHFKIILQSRLKSLAPRLGVRMLKDAIHKAASNFGHKITPTEISQVIEALSAILEPALSSPDRAIFRKCLVEAFPSTTPGVVVPKVEKGARFADDVSNDTKTRTITKITFTVQEPDVVGYNNAVDNAITELGLQRSQAVVDRVSKLNLAMQQTKNVVIFGAAGSGKTTLLKLLALVRSDPDVYLSTRSAHGTQNESPIDLLRLFPSALSQAELLGSYDSNGAWVDGVMPRLIRSRMEACADPKKWIVFDGWLGSEWVGRLDTVMSSESRLSLPSGEVLPISPNIKFLFESQDLNGVSPNLLMDAALFHVPTDVIQMKDIHQAWNIVIAVEFPTVYAYHRDFIGSFLEDIIGPTVKHICKSIKIYVSELDAAKNFLTILQSVLALELRRTTGEQDKNQMSRLLIESTVEELRKLLASLCIFSYVAAMDGYVPSGYAEEMDAFYRQQLVNVYPSTHLPEKGMLAEYFVDPLSMELRHHSVHMELAKNLTVQPDMCTSPIISELVPRYTILQALMSNGVPFFVSGPAGSGKSSLINRLWRDNRSTLGLLRQWSMTQNVTASELKTALIQNVCVRDPQKWNCMGHAARTLDKKTDLVLFVDDVNSASDPTDDNPIELLRQLLDQQSFHDSKARARSVRNMACVVSGTSLTDFKSAKRLSRHFVTIRHGFLKEESIHNIFRPMLDAWVHQMAPALPPNHVASITNGLNEVIQATLDVDNALRLRDDDDSNDNVFNVKTLQQVFSSLVLCVPCERASLDAARDFDILDLSDDESLDMEGLFDSDEDEDEPDPADPMSDAPFLIPHLWYAETMKIFLPHLPPKDRAWLPTFLAQRCEGILSVMTSGLVPKVQPIVPLSLGWKPVTPITGDDAMSGSDLPLAQFWETSDISEVAQLFQSLATAPSAAKHHSVKTVVTLDLALELSALCRSLVSKQHSVLAGQYGSSRMRLSVLAGKVCHREVRVVHPPSDGSLAEFRRRISSAVHAANRPSSVRKFLLTISNRNPITVQMLEDVFALMRHGWVPGMVRERDVHSQQDDDTVSVGRGEIQNVIQSGRLVVHLLLDEPMVSASPAEQQACMFETLGMFKMCARVQNIASSTDSRVGIAEGYLNDKLANSPDVTRVLMGLKKLALSKDHVALTSDMIGRLCKLLNDIYEHAAKTPATAAFADGSRFCIMVDTFTNLFKRQVKWLNTNMTLAQTLIDRVSRANDIIGEFQGQINQIVPIRDKANADCDMLYNDAVQKRNALESTVKRRILLENKIEETTKKIAGLRSIFERELKSCLVQLQEAEEALLSLRQDDIEELAEYVNPPSKVIITASPLCLLFRPYRATSNYAAEDPRLPRETKEPTWLETKLLLGQHQFFDRIANFDRDGISRQTLKMIQKIVYGGLYVPDELKSASNACYSLSQWVLAIVKYAEIQVRLEPFRRQLREAEAELADLLKNLKRAREQEEQLRLDVRAAKTELALAQEHRQNVLNQLKEIMLRQSRARKLFKETTPLVDLVRERLHNMQAVLSTLPGDLAIASACMNYSGTLTADERTGLTAFWSRRCAHWDVPKRDVFSFEAVVASPEDLECCVSQGLPADNRTLIGDVVMMRTSTRWPLIYDPYEIATNLLTQMVQGEGHQLARFSANSASLTADVVAAMRMGSSVLICDVEHDIRMEDAHPDLVNLLCGEKCVMDQGIRTVQYQIGSELIDVPSTFRAYMSRHGPFQNHDLQRPVCLVHFDDPALAHEQLLSTFVMIESPAMEDGLKKSNAKVMEWIQQLKADRFTLMDRMQHVTLSDFDTDTFTNEILGISKSHENGRVEEDSEKQHRQNLLLERSVHKELASHATVLFQFVISLERFGSMLNRYSLPSFVQMVKMWSSAQKGAADRTQTVLSPADMCKALNRRVHEWFGAGVDHVQLQEFSLSLTIEALRAAGDVTQPELDLFQSTKECSTDPATSGAGQPAWVTDSVWRRASRLAELEPFQMLLAELSEEELWEEYLHDGPSLYDRVPFVTADPSVLTPFQKVLLVQALQPLSLPEVCRELVVSQLGDKFFEKPSDLFAEVVAEPKPSVPVLIILSDDSDPLFDIMQYVYASKARGSCNQNATQATEDDRDAPQAWYSKSAGIKFASSAELGWSVRNLRLQPPASASVEAQPVVVVSLSGGKLETVIAVLRTAYTLGQWVVLHNCHLADKPLLLAVSQEFTELTTSERYSSGFRLWLTSRRTTSIPTALLLPSLKLQWRQCVRRGHRRRRWANRIMRSPLFGATHASSCTLVAEHLDHTLSAEASVHIPEAFRNENKIYESASLFQIAKTKFEADKLVHEQRRAELAKRLEARERSDFDRSWQIADALSALSSADLLIQNSDCILDVAAQFVFYAAPWAMPYRLTDSELGTIFADIFAPYASSLWQLDAIVSTLKNFACAANVRGRTGLSLDMASESDVLPILDTRAQALAIGKLSAFMLEKDSSGGVTLFEGPEVLAVPTEAIRKHLESVFAAADDAISFFEDERRRASSHGVVVPSSLKRPESKSMLSKAADTSKRQVPHFVKWQDILAQTTCDSHSDTLAQLFAVKAAAHGVLACVNGLVEWSDATHGVAVKLARGFMPCEWISGDCDVAIPRWCDLVRRCKSSATGGADAASSPAPYTIGAQAICNPSSLLVSLRKSIADQWQVDLEQVSVDFCLSEEASAPAGPSAGVGVPVRLTIAGLFLVGAEWADGSLKSQFASTHSLDMGMSKHFDVAVTFALRSSTRVCLPDSGTYLCPLVSIDQRGETTLGKLPLTATPHTVPLLHASGARIILFRV